MKKVILSLVAMAFGGAVMAQNGTLAGNVPTAGGDGFTFEFLMTGTENCLASGGVAYDAATTQAWSIDGSGNLVVTVPVSGTYESNPQTLKFYTGNCIGSTIDLSTVADQNIQISLNSPMAGQIVVVLYTGSSSNYNTTPSSVPPGNGPAVIDIVAGQQTVSSVLDPAGTGMSAAALTKVGLLFRGPTGWNDATFNGTVTIDYVKLGTAVTAGTTIAVDNSLISVYPNPAKEQISIDLSSMNNASDASVKIMNSNGMLVYEGNASNSNEIINTSSFNKGIYLVQVSAGNKISNKKLVIE
jgi:hypothetical protein